MKSIFSCFPMLFYEWWKMLLPVYMLLKQAEYYRNSILFSIMLWCVNTLYKGWMEDVVLFCNNLCVGLGDSRLIL
jgi:hypothetical protein